jgi:hypothetical protein
MPPLQRWHFHKSLVFHPHPCGLPQEQDIDYHKVICKTQYETWASITPQLDHLRTFGALVTACTPSKLPTKADRHTAHGVLIGFRSSKKHVRYFELTTNFEKLSYHHIIDEAHNGTSRHPVGPQVLMDMGFDIPSAPKKIVIVPPPLSQYPLRSRKKSITPLYITLLPLPLREFPLAPVVVAASLAATKAPLEALEFHRDDSIMVTFSTDPFGPSFPEKKISLSYPSYPWT